MRANVKQGLGERDDVRHKAQHDDADNHRQRQPNDAGFVAQGEFHFACEDGNENQVINAQHHFQYKQRGETYPCLRLGEPTDVHCGENPLGGNEWG